MGDLQPCLSSLKRLNPFLQEILEAAAHHTGFSQPGPFKPSACICNFYENSGRLGYHQASARQARTDPNL